MTALLKQKVVSMDQILNVEVSCGSVAVLVELDSAEAARRVSAAVARREVILKVGDATVVATLSAPSAGEGDAAAEAPAEGDGIDVAVDGGGGGGGGGGSDGDGGNTNDVGNEAASEASTDGDDDGGAGGGAAVGVATNQWADSKVVLPVVAGSMALILTAFTIWIIYRHHKYSKKKKNKVGVGSGNTGNTGNEQHAGPGRWMPPHNGHAVSFMHPRTMEDGAGGGHGHPQPLHQNLFQGPNGTMPRWMVGKNKGKRALLFQPPRHATAAQTEQMAIRQNQRMMAMLQNGQRMDTPFMDHMYTGAGASPAGPWNVTPRAPAPPHLQPHPHPHGRAGMKMSPYPPAQWYTPRQQGGSLGPLRAGGGAGGRGARSRMPLPARPRPSPQLPTLTRSFPSALARAGGGRGHGRGRGRGRGASAMLPPSQQRSYAAPRQPQQPGVQHAGAHAHVYPTSYAQPQQAPWFNNAGQSSHA